VTDDHGLLQSVPMIYCRKLILNILILMTIFLSRFFTNCLLIQPVYMIKTKVAFLEDRFFF